MIQLRNITKSFDTIQVLKGIDLDVQKGEIVSIVGPSGAGKTTLMKCIFGFISHKGEITLDGEKISHKNIEKLSFATCEHSFFPALTPKAHLVFYKEHFPSFKEKTYKGLMEFFGLPDDRPLRTFSAGQKNQFEVIMALCQGADYILMDEPFAGNDVFNSEDF